LDNSNIKPITLPNFFNDDYYDDFSVPGNSQFIAFAVESNLLTYARDLDTQQFYILRRKKNTPGSTSEKLDLENNNSNTGLPSSPDNKKKLNSDSQLVWKLAFLGNYLNLTNQQFYHTKALMFLQDEKYEFKLIHLFLRYHSFIIYII